MRALILAIGMTATACEKPVVEWSEVSYPMKVPAAATAVSSGAPQVGDTNACRTSLRTGVSGPDSVAAWWSIRSDSSSVLMFSRTIKGKWSVPTVVDTTDASRRGCGRPAPAIAADLSAGYVHLVYFLEPTNGAGVFFAHSMDATGFHDPVSIAFGKRASDVSVASSGDRIAVAYEEPNAERGQIWLALSATMGHIFESRLPVSSGNEIAESPAVSLDGTKLEVKWTERLQADSLGRSRLATRTGTWN